MKETILIIDDDPVMAATLKSMAETWGLNAVLARSGEEGLETVREQPVDVVVSDIRMPGLSGHDVLKSLRKETPHLPVILLTAHGSVKSAVESIREGAFDYVVKPPDPDELRVATERALEHARLHRENDFLRAELSAGGLYGEQLMGRSPKMLEVFDLIQRVARTDSTVLITGETGTGKELVAQAIHFKSRRASCPLVACNCAALNTNLLESELFGHEKGAFTGAVGIRRGRFEEANGGTLFLDEISETSTEFQANLLRVLQEGEIQRVGGGKVIKVNVRILASTNRDITAAVEDGSFREDLYYRLRVVPIHLPPLRERKEDIVPLSLYFLSHFNEEYDCGVLGLTPEGNEFLLRQEWPGNVRELKHTIERAVVLARTEYLGPQDLVLEKATDQAASGSPTLQSFLDAQSSDYLIRILDSTNWHKQRTAEILGIDRATLYRLLKKFSIEKPATKSRSPAKD